MESFPNIEIYFRETYIHSLITKVDFFLFYINWYPQRSVRSPEIVVPGGCELSYECWESNTGSLE